MDETTLSRMGSSAGGCLTALESLKDSFIQLYHTDDETFWKFKHPTIGDALSRILSESQESLKVYITGAKVTELLHQITCGSVDVEQAIIIPKPLFPLVIEKLNAFVLSPHYKDQATARWDAKERLLTFLSYRCSKEFLSLYIKATPDLLKKVASPGLYLNSVSSVEVAVRLHEVGLLPDKERKEFVNCVVEYAKEGQDYYVVESEKLYPIFTKEELDMLFSWIDEELVPNLTEKREEFIEQWDSANDSAESYMDRFLDLLKSLLKRFKDNKFIKEKIETEIQLSKDWVSENEADFVQEVNRPFDDSDTGKDFTGIERSIFDDIDLE